MGRLEKDPRVVDGSALERREEWSGSGCMSWPDGEAVDDDELELSRTGEGESERRWSIGGCGPMTFVLADVVMAHKTRAAK